MYRSRGLIFVRSPAAARRWPEPDLSGLDDAGDYLPVPESAELPLPVEADWKTVMRQLLDARSPGTTTNSWRRQFVWPNLLVQQRRVPCRSCRYCRRAPAAAACSSSSTRRVQPIRRIGQRRARTQPGAGAARARAGDRRVDAAGGNRSGLPGGHQRDAVTGSVGIPAHAARRGVLTRVEFTRTVPAPATAESPGCVRAASRGTRASSLRIPTTDPAYNCSKPVHAARARTATRPRR